MISNRLKLTIPLFLLLAISSLNAKSEWDSTNRSSYFINAVKIKQDLNITGKLSDPLWKNAPKVQLNFEIQPGNNTPAPQKTTAMVLYNSKYIYIGFICYDTNPSKIRAHITDRDNAFNDDFAGVILDTYHDHQRAYELYENPYGVQMDGLMNGKNEDYSFDLLWYSKASINDSGYTAVMAIPFKSLRFQDKNIQSWGIDFLRNIPRESSIETSWTRVEINDPCLLCYEGTLTGLKDLGSSGSFNFLPYVMGFESGNIIDDSKPNSEFYNGPLRIRAGAGFTYIPNPSLSLEVVGNPDFSQVESDAAQINVNSNFALFYPEKRPFFMEGSDIFSTLIQVYYSRMISNPEAAAKIVNKSGAWSVAYLGAEDRNTPFIIAGEEGSVSDNNGDNTFSTTYKSFSNIFRARYNFGLQSFAGVIATTRNFTYSHNYTGGIDWNLFFGNNYTFDGQFLISNTRELNDTSLISNLNYFGNTGFTKAFDGQEYTGTGFQTDFRRDARNYSFRITYKDFSPTFQAEDGYISSNDLRTADVSQNLSYYPKNSLVDEWGINLESGLHFNYSRVRKERWLIPQIFLNLKSQTQINLNYFLVNDELYHGFNFKHVNRWNLSINSNPINTISFNFNAAFGRFIYRAEKTALGAGHNISTELVVKPTNKFSLTLDYSRSRLTNSVGGELLFDGYIARLKGIYNFNTRIFIRLIAQYNQFNQNVEIDPLFSYRLNAFTIFYAGLTNSLEKFEQPYGLIQTNRQFFLKLQYLLQD